MTYDFDFSGSELQPYYMRCSDRQTRSVKSLERGKNIDFSRAIGFVAVARWARKHFWLSALRVRGERDGITLFVRSLSFSV